MKGRDKLFFNLLTFLLLVVLVLVGIRTRDADRQIKKWQKAIKDRQERGVHDPQLKQTVDKLESDLRKRFDEVFELETDPLDLTRVIKTKKFLKALGMTETAETEGKMRLSCTVIGEETPSAIIKYKGRSYVLEVGDKLGSPDQDIAKRYKVVWIGTNSVKLKRGVEELVLVTEKAPDTIAAEEMMFGENEEKKPIVEVKQVQIGNF